MKIIFAGTPPFAASALKTLVDAGHEIALVLTQPDRPAGRGMKNTASAVKLLAQKHQYYLLQPSSLKSLELHTELRALRADVMVVAAYGLILPSPILSIPTFGCLNIHASLLPRWRGAAPIERAILAGDQKTGITIMQMDQGLDTGNILLQRSISIEPHDTSQTLHDKLALLGACCIVQALTLLQEGKLPSIAQNEGEATYAPKVEKDEAEIDWRVDAESIERAIRAFNPRPGAHSRINGITIKIWKGRVMDGATGEPGEIIATGRDGIVVSCGNSALILEIVQKSGGKKLSASEFLAGHTLHLGNRFE
jgi:methionyl-tRNA formyltransferase